MENNAEKRIAHDNRNPNHGLPQVSVSVTTKISTEKESES